MLNHLEFLCFA